MDFDELLQKFNLLLNENDRLIKENSRLRAQLGLGESEPIQNTVTAKTTKSKIPGHESVYKNCLSGVDRTSDSPAKIRLFMSLFSGRDDVYAKRWENTNKGTSGYSPVCLHQWQPGVCGKPKIPCSKCKNGRYAPLDENVIEDHLKGKIVAGIYPMLPDETCHFLAMDFDEAGWQKDISVVRQACTTFNIPFAVERSRSGKGGFQGPHTFTLSVLLAQNRFRRLSFHRGLPIDSHPIATDSISCTSRSC
jgi:hypothetical protein